MKKESIMFGVLGLAVGLVIFVFVRRSHGEGLTEWVTAPDEQVFISWFEGGEVFRSGCCWTRGNGSIFYFRPGHETFPTYFDANVQRVIANAALWAAPRGTWVDSCPNVKQPTEKISPK